MKKKDGKNRRAPLIPRNEDLAWRRILDSLPVQSPTCEVEQDTGHGVVLIVRGKRPGFLVPPLSWIIRPRLTHRVQLDALGAEVWRQCDGKHRLEEIVDAFAAAHGLSFHEARVAVMNCIGGLMQRSVLAVGIP